jgi:GNAT superfamily N-acetyltransferase
MSQDQPEIIAQSHLGILEWDFDGVSRQVSLDHLVFNNAPFDSSISGRMLDDNNIVGGVVFLEKDADMIIANPDHLVLMKLEVGKQYQRNGFGKFLLTQAKDYARGKSRSLVLVPGVPELSEAELAQKGYSMTTDELKAMYLRNGFREFSLDEMKVLSLNIASFYLNQAIIVNGYESPNGQVSSSKLSLPENIAALDQIAMTEREKILSDVLRKKGIENTFVLKIIGYFNEVRRHLICDN